MSFDNAVRIGAVEQDSRDPEGYWPVRLVTDRGTIDGRAYPVAGARTGCIWVGGVGGDFDTPARGLYPRLCKELTERGIASLRVRFRFPTDLDEAVYDVRTGIAYLQAQGIGVIGLTGHSFGGAVVIQAAARSEAVRAVTTLATQSYGADDVWRLQGRCPILLIHGREDPVLPPASSDHVYRIARQPKRLKLFAGAGHGLDEVAEEVHPEVRGWIVENLGKAAGMR